MGEYRLERAGGEVERGEERWREVKRGGDRGKVGGGVLARTFVPTRLKHRPPATPPVPRSLPHPPPTPTRTLTCPPLPQTVRVYAAVIAGACIVGGAGMIGAKDHYPRRAPIPGESRPRSSSLLEQMSMLESVRIFRRPYFWCMVRTRGGVCGVGNGVFGVCVGQCVCVCWGSGDASAWWGVSCVARGCGYIVDGQWTSAVSQQLL